MAFDELEEEDKQVNVRIEAFNEEKYIKSNKNTPILAAATNSKRGLGQPIIIQEYIDFNELSFFLMKKHELMKSGIAPSDIKALSQSLAGKG